MHALFWEVQKFACHHNFQCLVATEIWMVNTGPEHTTARFINSQLFNGKMDCWLVKYSRKMSKTHMTRNQMKMKQPTQVRIATGSHRQTSQQSMQIIKDEKLKLKQQEQ